MKTIVTLIVSLLVLDPAHAELGDKAKLLLRKLAEFESSERFKADIIIEKKRQEVAKTLITYRDQALRAKNLEKANAIDAKIKELKAGKAVMPNEDPIIGMWIWHNGAVISFFSGGVAFCSFKNKQSTLEWARQPDRSYVLTWAEGNKSTHNIVRDVMAFTDTPNKGKKATKVK